MRVPPSSTPTVDPSTSSSLHFFLARRLAAGGRSLSADRRVLHDEGFTPRSPPIWKVGIHP
jgi:hypothetical protein